MNNVLIIHPESVLYEVIFALLKMRKHDEAFLYIISEDVEEASTVIGCCVFLVGKLNG